VSKSRSVVAIILICLFLWTAISFPQKVVTFKTKLHDTLNLPLQLFAKTLRYTEEISPFAYRSRRVDTLEKMIASLKRDIAELEEVRLENERLRDLLRFRRASRKGSIPALVIGRDPNKWSSVIYIDKGRQNHVGQDAVVIASEGLAGRVREVGKFTSKVLLINDVDSRVGALIQPSREQGLLVGTPEGGCKLIYLSLESDVAPGAKIVTSGMGGLFPKGVYVGKVRTVAKEKGRLYKYAVVEPAVDLGRIEEVLCVK